MHLEREIAAAANWWLSEIQEAILFEPVHQDRIGAILASLRPPVSPLSDAQCRSFRETFIEVASVQSIPDNSLTVSVDYYPSADSPLALACAASQIPNEFLLKKTVMWISPDSVVVRVGRNGREEQIYPLP